MISIELVRGGNGEIIGFSAKNHGKSIVCAAVSMLVINTINSIEKLTRQALRCDYLTEGGYITFERLTPYEAQAGLLLEAMMLGLYSAKENYPLDIEITERK